MKIHKRRSRIRKWHVAGAFLLLLVCSGFAAFYATRSDNILSTTPTSTVKTPQPNTPPAPKLAVVSEKPSRLIIEKINVDAVIQPVGLTSTGAMDAPLTNEGVGWYDKSALAGHDDFAVLLDGHFGTDARPAVFYRLSEMVIGDTITVQGEKGAHLTYKIVETETQKLEDVDMRKALYPYKEGAQSLTIITCEGTYDRGRATYDKRSIVYAERVS